MHTGFTKDVTWVNTKVDSVTFYIDIYIYICIYI